MLSSRRRPPESELALEFTRVRDIEYIASARVVLAIARRRGRPVTLRGFCEQHVRLLPYLGIDIDGLARCEPAPEQGMSRCRSTASAFTTSISGCASRRSGAVDPMPDPMEIIHLRREVKTALELAVVALAPEAVVDRLAAAAGVLEAVAELPTEAAPLVALVPRTIQRARAALQEWHEWHDRRAPEGTA